MGIQLRRNASDEKRETGVDVSAERVVDAQRHI
jgi:hypothetical protein